MCGASGVGRAGVPDKQQDKGQMQYRALEHS